MTAVLVDVNAVTTRHALEKYVKDPAVEDAIREKTAVQKARAAAARNPEPDPETNVQV